MTEENKTQQTGSGVTDTNELQSTLAVSGVTDTNELQSTLAGSGVTDTNELQSTLAGSGITDTNELQSTRTHGQETAKDLKATAGGVVEESHVTAEQVWESRCNQADQCD